MKLFKSAVAALPLLLLCATLADAQSGFNAYFGMGTAHDGSNGQVLDLLGTGSYASTSSMGGVFGTLGGGVMLNDSFGVGAEIMFRFAQGDYAGLGYRPIFYDFNGIWTPNFGTKRIVPELQAGLGGLNLRFYGGGTYCDPYTGFCSNYAGSFNHFQLHAGAGLRIFVSEHIFVRPQIDYHWVHGLTDQFKSNSVPAYSVAIGFSTQ